MSSVPSNPGGSQPSTREEWLIRLRNLAFGLQTLINCCPLHFGRCTTCDMVWHLGKTVDAYADAYADHLAKEWEREAAGGAT